MDVESATLYAPGPWNPFATIEKPRHAASKNSNKKTARSSRTSSRTKRLLRRSPANRGSRRLCSSCSSPCRFCSSSWARASPSLRSVRRRWSSPRFKQHPHRRPCPRPFRPGASRPSPSLLLRGDSMNLVSRFIAAVRAAFRAFANVWRTSAVRPNVARPKSLEADGFRRRLAEVRRTPGPYRKR